MKEEATGCRRGHRKGQAVETIKKNRKGDKNSLSRGKDKSGKWQVRKDCEMSTATKTHHLSGPGLGPRISFFFFVFQSSSSAY